MYMRHVQTLANSKVRHRKVTNVSDKCRTVTYVRRLVTNYRPVIANDGQ